MYGVHTNQHAPWSILVPKQEGCGWQASYMNVMPPHLYKFIVSARSGRICSLEISRASTCAGESHWTSCCHCGNPLDEIIHACTHRLLFCREPLRGVDTEWPNVVDIGSIQGLNLLRAQPGSMEAGLLCERFFKRSLSPRATLKSMLLQYWTSVCTCLNADQSSSCRWFGNPQTINEL
jgi:hypothetical protein